MTEGETEPFKNVVVDLGKPSFSTTTSTTVELAIDVADAPDAATSIQNSKAVEKQKNVVFPTGDKEYLAHFSQIVGCVCDEHHSRFKSGINRSSRS